MSSSENKKIIVTVFLSVKDQAEIGIKETNYSHSSTFLTAVYCRRPRPAVLRKPLASSGCFQPEVPATESRCLLLVWAGHNLIVLSHQKKVTTKAAGVRPVLRLPRVLSCFFTALVTSPHHCG